MNFPELQGAIEHLLKTSKCLHCSAKYTVKDINVVATTNMEGLFEMKCSKCKGTTLLTVILASNREHAGLHISSQHTITENDVLDLRNFLRHFDGDFKKIFPNT